MNIKKAIMVNMANIQPVEASYSPKANISPKTRENELKLIEFLSKSMSFDFIKLVFLAKLEVLTIKLASPCRLASRIREASHLYTTRLITLLRLQSLLTRLVSEPPVAGV